MSGVTGPGVTGDPAQDVLLFYGHAPAPDGRIGPGCLSQWWPAPFVVDGCRFATAEHFMMWRKAVLFGDDAAAARVLEVGDPREAKAVGRAVAGFDSTVWDERRLDAVVDGNLAKFGQHGDLAAYLLGTGERVLAEASPRDRVWGIGLGASNPRAVDPAQWRGRNLLGLALMRVRDRLRATGP